MELTSEATIARQRRFQAELSRYRIENKIDRHVILKMDKFGSIWELRGWNDRHLNSVGEPKTGSGLESTSESTCAADGQCPMCGLSPKTKGLSAAIIASRGGKARARALSPERRKEIAKLGAERRWKK